MDSSSASVSVIVMHITRNPTELTSYNLNLMTKKLVELKISSTTPVTFLCGIPEAFKYSSPQ